MTTEFLRTVLTPRVREAQSAAYGRTYPEYPPAIEPDTLGPVELEFIRARDSFYMASISETGWPYVQHRGGPAGLLIALTPKRLGFADYGGNRQLVSVGNLQHEARVCLFLMDYPARQRLKILGRAEVHEASLRPELVEATTPRAGHAARPERVIIIDVASFDWNCPKFITPRFSGK